MPKITKIHTDEPTNFQGYKLDENGVPVFESLQIGSVSLKSQTDGTVVLTDKTTGEVKSTLEINRESEQAVTKVFGDEIVEDSTTAFQPVDIDTFTANVFDEGREQYQMQFDLQADSDRHTVAYRGKSTTGLENVRVLIYSITNQDPTGTPQETEYNELVSGQWWMTKNHIWSTRKKSEVVYERGRKEDDSYVSPYDLVPDVNEYVSIDVDVTYEAGHYYRVLVCADNAFDLKGLDNTVPDPINGGTQFFLYTERTYRDIQKIIGQNTVIKFDPTDTVDFERDATDTTIITDSGDSFAVNSIKAINVNGTISIITIKGDKAIYTDINHENVTITGLNPYSSITTVINALNALFTVTPLGLGGEYITTIPTSDGVAITGNFAEGQDPIGDSIYGVGSDTSQHGARVWSTETIDEPGEFYEVKLTGKGQFMIGLYDANSNDLTEIQNNTGNGHSGYLWANAFYNYGSYISPWTWYGSNSSGAIKEGWSGSQDKMMRYNGIVQDNLADADPNTPVLFKVGITSEGYIAVYYFDEGRSNQYIMTSRSSYTLPEGNYGLLVKLVNGAVQLIELPTRSAVDPTAPILTYHYIESPDGEFSYPLFSTQEEANYYDSLNGGTGSGSSHTHVYVDDPTQTVWYMPDNGGTMHSGTVAPSNTSEITYNEIPTDADSLFVPSAFLDQTITVNEGDALNLQLVPAGAVGYTTTIGGIPAFTLNNGYLQGTAPEVADDNVTNPSDTTTVTVYRTNSFGTSQGTLTIVINNLTPPTIDVTGANHEGPATLTGSVASASTWFSLDESLSAGERLIVKGSFLEDILSEMNNLDNVIIGLKASGWDNTKDGYSYGDESTTGLIDNFKIRLYKNQNGAKFAQINHNNNNVALGSPQFNAGVSMANMNLFLEITASGNNIRGGWSYGNDSLTHVTTLTYGDFPTTNANKAQTGDQGFGITSADLMIWWDRNATTAGDFDYNEVDWTALTEQSVPVAATNSTLWTKAIDFSGSNEHLKQVSPATTANPLRMQAIAQTASLNTDLSKTSNDTYSRPWACVVVFKADFDGNQHIWNSGEGAGSSNDNIYIRTTANNTLHFGWGRDGSINETTIGTGLSSSIWYAVYVGHTGARFSGSNATAANLNNAFDIRIMSSADGFDSISSNITNFASVTGGRMDRAIGGDFTIGGRGSNRSFKGKVARMVITTLRRNVDMPNTDEIKLMITDPEKWEDNYRVGQTVRSSSNAQEGTYNPNSPTLGYFGLIRWYMGDGINDNLMSTGIRNHTYPSDQNNTRLQGNSLVSNDVQTVNIVGLS